MQQPTEKPLKVVCGLLDQIISPVSAVSHLHKKIYQALSRLTDGELGEGLGTRLAETISLTCYKAGSDTTTEK